MRKISTILKTAFFAAVLLFSGKAAATVNVDAIVGQWQFTADFTLIDQSWDGELLNNNTVTVTKVSSTAMMFDNFVWIDSQRRVSNSYSYYVPGSGWVYPPGQFSLVAQELSGTYGEGGYYFAPVDGLNPTGGPGRDNYYIIFTLEEDGTITMPDFSVVEVTGTGNNDTDIIAVYKNPKMTWIGGEEEGYDFQGVYTVSGTLTSYTDGNVDNASIQENASFNMVILVDKENNTPIPYFDQFAGYTGLAAYYPGSGFTGQVKGDVMTIPSGQGLYYDRLDETDPYFITTSNGVLNTEEVTENGVTVTVPVFNSAGTITLAYDNGNYTLTDFTIWKRSYLGLGAYTLLSKWSNLSVVQTVDSAVVDKIETEVNAPAVYYNLQGVRVNNPSNGVFIKKEGNKTSKVILK